MSEDEQQHYLIEFVPVGSSVKVSAVDPATGTEVAVVGPATASEADLTRAAVRKLEYVLRKNVMDARARKGGSAGSRGGGGRVV